MAGGLNGEVIWLPRFFQGVYEPYKLLGDMRDCDVVVLTFGAFLSKIVSKGWVPMANKLGSVEERVPQIPRTAFRHVRVG